MSVFALDFSSLPCLLQLYSMLGYICRITVNYGTLKGGSLLINVFASSNCFSDRNIFQNGVDDALTKIDDAFFYQKISSCLSSNYVQEFVSLWHKHLLWNYIQANKNYTLMINANWYHDIENHGISRCWKAL